VPLYFQISGDLQRRIESGELPPGTRIPGEKQLFGSLEDILTTGLMSGDFRMGGPICRRQPPDD
jgi:DNA-binding transcriptional MocR family regulator